MPVTRRVQTDFRGYDHRPGCPEGGIYEMTNGSAADAPLFSTRLGRTLTYPTGGGSANGLFAVDGGLLWCTGQTLYFNGAPVDGCTLVNGPKVFAELGGTVLIWPDKVWYRPDMGTFGSAEPSWSGTVALQRSDDSSGARADSVAASGIDTPFRVGDAVTFSGFSTPEDTGTDIIRDIAGAALVFASDTRKHSVIPVDTRPNTAGIVSSSPTMLPPSHAAGSTSSAPHPSRSGPGCGTGSSGCRVDSSGRESRITRTVIGCGAAAALRDNGVCAAGVCWPPLIVSFSCFFVFSQTKQQQHKDKKNKGSQSHTQNKKERVNSGLD